MPSSWPMEALKAQAIAARTYAAEKIARTGQARVPCKCGMYSSTLDQAYVGFEKEGGPAGDRWKAAVDSTDGIVLMASDRMIEAYYHSSSGGHTENNEFVWGGAPRSYLRGVPDPWDGGPRHTWTVRFSRQDLQNRLAARPDTNPGELASVRIVPPLGVSGRVLSWANPSQGGVKVMGSGGERRISGSRFRSALGMLSTLFYEGEVRRPAPSVVAAAAPATGLQGHPNGTVVKGSKPGMYFIEAGKRRPVAQGVYNTRFRSGEVVTISDQELAAYPLGERLLRRDGSLINAPGGPVWIISDGKRRGFVSGDVFGKLGYSWSNVRPVAPSDLTYYPEGAPVTAADKGHPNGTVIKGSGPAVYVIEGGHKRLVSPAVFASRYKTSETVTVSDTEIAAYPDGEKLGFRDGSLVQSRQGTLFVISDGKRRPISPERFTALNYSRPNLLVASDEDLNLHPEGEPL
ncbi:MAG: SpoIID/LytB domain-containing protein [Actinomycetota bacterium]|nr:SpoIID/LytB domain-containing protein [Actinomycetota bacterium]